MRALIVDSGQGRGGLAAARALAREGWTVGMAGPTRVGLGMLSRAVRHRHLIPPHSTDTSAFVQAVEEAISARDYEVVFGCSDGEALTLSRERHRVHAAVPHPPHAVMVRAHDKVELGAAAEKVGMSVPPSAASGAEARDRWGAEPMIVKERLHVPPTTGEDLPHLATHACATDLAVDQRVEELRAAGAIPVVQPLLGGHLMAFASVLDRQGRMLDCVQQVAERTYPRQAGLSVRAQTVAVEEPLVEQVCELLSELDWFGLSQLQFIVPPTGIPVLLDFNGRFYGSISLALAAGVNLPDTWARMITGRTPLEARRARPGVRYQWLEGDLRAARERPRGPLRDAVASMRYRSGACPSIWRTKDPIPGLLTVGSLLRTSARLLRRTAHGSESPAL